MEEKTIVKMLEAFKNAAKELTAEWSFVAGRDYKIDMALADQFPFKDSFDDVAIDIEKWTNRAILKINEIENKRYSDRTQLDFDLFRNAKVRLNREQFDEMVGQELNEDFALMYRGEYYIEIMKDGRYYLCIGRCDWIEEPKDLVKNELRLFLFDAEEKRDEKRIAWAKSKLNITDDSWYW